MTWFIYAPLNRFVLRLADGWRFQDVAEPMLGHHGKYSVLMWGHDEPR